MEEDGVWRTIRGRRIFIKKGENLDSAMKRSGKFNIDDNRKQKQLDVIKKNNPAEDDVHTWIRSVDDIKTFQETLKDDEWKGWEEDGFDPDYSADDVKKH